jgi:hypothetical protein
MDKDHPQPIGWLAMQVKCVQRIAIINITDRRNHQGGKTSKILLMIYLVRFSSRSTSRTFIKH